MWQEKTQTGWDGEFGNSIVSTNVGLSYMQISRPDSASRRAAVLCETQTPLRLQDRVRGATIDSWRQQRRAAGGGDVDRCGSRYRPA